MIRIKISVIVLAAVLTGHGFIFAEGTKQIQPTAASAGKMQVQPNWSPFAWYDRFGVSGPADYRLNIHIREIGEVIHYGFGDPLTERDSVRYDVEYRIKDPLGNIVAGPAALPLSGPGHISSFSQAVAGPSALAGASGYPELSYTPLMTGDYYIEFQFPLTWNNEHKQCKFRYFDITVENNAHVANDGRVWSKSWQFSSDKNGNPGYPFEGKLYVYSDDQIVTRCDLNGIDPLVFSMVCNGFGCANTGNFLLDRQSRAGYAVIPEFKIFLNDPDILVYPTGVLGQLIPPVGCAPDCNGNIDFTINVTQNGHVEILLDINPLPGIQPEDTVLFAHVVAGLNTISWGGINGIGQPVLAGTVINATITYYNGLTNLPLYDVELNAPGFKVDLVRPTGPALRVFWDDTLVGGTVNLTGCDYNVSVGCHPFTYGNNNTINTWWYAISPQMAPLQFTYIQTPGPVGPIAGPTPVCPGSVGRQYRVRMDPNSTTVQWNYTGTGVTINQVNDTTVLLDFATSATSGNLTASGYNPFCGNGPASVLAITVPPYPQVTNNPTFQVQCNNTATNIHLTSNVTTATFTWTCSASHATISGYGPGSGNLINQVLTNDGNTAGTVTYAITPIANGCTGPITFYTVTIQPTTLVTSTPLTQQQCNNQATNFALTSNVSGTLFSWTCTPTSSNVSGFSPGTGNVINQVLINSGNNPEGVTYHITPSILGCSGPVADFKVTVHPVACLTNNPPAQAQCSSQGTNITLLSNTVGAMFTWTCTPSSASVTGWSNNATPVTQINQTLVNTSYVPQTVTYNITPWTNGCPGPLAHYTVTVNPIPQTTFSICNDPVTTVNSRPIQLRGGIPLGGTYSGPGVTSPTFSPSLAGPGNHVITYSYTNMFGCVTSATRTLTVQAATPFTCGGTLTDVRDNKTYATVQVGSQCWMAENLNYGTQINSSQAQRDNCVVEKYCVANIAGNCSAYGGFYQWDEMMHYGTAQASQGICPPGWHVPAQGEWNSLFNTFDPYLVAIAAANLKSTGPSGYDANVNGFNGFNRVWTKVNFATMFWSSSAHSQFKAWAHGMNTPDDGVSSYPGFRANGFSVRCVQD